MPFNTLIDTGTLAVHLSDPSWVAFDCRFDLTQADAGRRAYRAGHIPGARYAHLEEDLSSPITPVSGRHPLPDVDNFARKLGQWGVDGRTQVIVYDEGGGAIAARLWWLLRWLGHSATALLDGGLAKWQREQRPLSTDVPVPVPAEFRARRDDSFWVSTSYVQRAIGGDEHLLIDARAAKRFRGEIEPLDKVAGHIPGSINWPFQNNLDATGCFHAPARLREKFLLRLKERSPAQVISTCGSGVTACHNILAMERAGLTGAKLYAGSWSEWIADGKRPIATGDA